MSAQQVSVYVLSEDIFKKFLEAMLLRHLLVMSERTVLEVSKNFKLKLTLINVILS